MDMYSGVYPVEGKPNRWVLRMCYTVNGKTHRDTRTVTANSKKQAYSMKVKLVEELKEQALGITTKDNKMTFRELVSRWKVGAISDLSYTTWYTYEGMLNNVILGLMGNKPIREITKGDIYDFIDAVKEQGRYSPKTIRNQVMLVRSVMTYAFEHELIDTNPFDRVKLDSIQAADPLFFTDQQLANMLRLLDQEVERLKNSFSVSIRYKKLDKKERELKEDRRLLDLYGKRLFVNLAIVTGARRGEIIGLVWDDLDMENNLIKFKGTAYKKPGEISQFKDCLKNGNRAKLVYLNDAIMPMIKEYKEFQSKVIKKNHWKTQGHLFLTLREGKIGKPGDPIGGDIFSQWFSKWAKKNASELGLNAEQANKAHVHMLRHSSISYELNSGVDLKTVAGRAGHNDASVTDKIYGHLYDNTMKSAALPFDRLYAMKDGESTEDEKNV